MFDVYLEVIFIIIRLFVIYINNNILLKFFGAEKFLFEKITHPEVK